MTYLRETRTTPKAFAHMIGLDLAALDEILAGGAPLAPQIAQRMVDATGGALLLDDLIDNEYSAPGVIDLRRRFAAASEIDIEKLAEVLAQVLPELVGGARRAGEEHLPGLAADAAASTYAALSTITTRSGPDRLMQALQPVFAEILEEFSAPDAARRRLPKAIEQATSLYFQVRPNTRRA